MPTEEKCVPLVFGESLVRERLFYKKLRRKKPLPVYVQTNFFPALYGAGEE